MLETLAVCLMLLWLLGFLSATTLGISMHILLATALVVFVIRALQARRI